VELYLNFHTPKRSFTRTCTQTMGRIQTSDTLPREEINMSVKLTADFKAHTLLLTFILPVVSSGVSYGEVLEDKYIRVTVLYVVVCFVMWLYYC
jgi:hypothetical protein